MTGAFADVFAHSLPPEIDRPWEPLEQHLLEVADGAAAFADPFGWAEVARMSGLLHDLGKLSPQFQSYIRGDQPVGGDHSTAGAVLARQTYDRSYGSILSAIIAAHHAGLADGIDLQERLKRAGESLPARWEQLVGPLPPPAALAPGRAFERRGPQGFTLSFLIRMLFSCLVDADFLATEAFYAQAQDDDVARGGHLPLAVLHQRLTEHMQRLGAGAPDTPLNALRAEILAHATAKAALPPGLFSLTVPTGGGKTLASLSFALEHAVRHGLRRVIYVIPFTSIIEQTAQVFRHALGTRDDILEHHASFDWDEAVTAAGADREGADGLTRLRRAAENWDVPIVVTTAVQFFESLFANRTSRCRKLHNIAGSVVVLDEAQTLPLTLLRPCMAALDELARHYRTSVVLCTATQPALRAKDHFTGGFELGDDRELAPDPERLYAALKRVEVETLVAPVADGVVADRFTAQPQMLCIVNSRAHAQELYGAIRQLPGALHLTTLMCPRHRRAVLSQVRSDLAAGRPVRLVATSLIEAGVDVDFPEVWRAAAGLESIAQAAGRCNREGRRASGRVVVFQPEAATGARDVRLRWQAAAPILAASDDPLGLDAVRAYFRELYWQKGPEAFDTAEVAGRPGILRAIRERAADGAFPFRSIAEAFRLIEETMVSVVVPWRADAEDDDAKLLLDRIAAMEQPSGGDLRRLQQYMVPIPRAARNEWLAAKVLRPVHRNLGDDVLRFEGLDLYDPDMGVNLKNTTLRNVEANIIS
ncbi:CRISPR-associated endonuclease Cas3'' [Xanthobacter oligotrophicus]|uniref:CRISPR-associated endonuclease Cas3'' n=1 Tax=Xanthobacter oligotrophicus TaxID=2607286 RepID=UPI0011F1A7E5|nr:CRISPR-associated endonuclease Cas3'' [Xanthobacter oligotrophicus]MCG5234078.1 CRISPR-associated endonuclease Cas3'' [Xanthobacter oligotrophicus]